MEQRVETASPLAPVDSGSGRNWSEPVGVTYGKSPPQQMYTNQIAPYHRAPHVLFGKDGPPRPRQVAHPSGRKPRAATVTTWQKRKCPEPSVSRARSPDGHR